MVPSLLDSIEIILVEPHEEGNIGSVCRAMKTMGLHSLTIIKEHEYNIDRIKTLSVHAFDIWEKREERKSLEEALLSSSFSVAATRRKGKLRKLSTYSPEDLAKKAGEVAPSRISIVFGREADGLRDDEVNLCSSVVTIPTSEEFPSLNLAQAVQIIAYELYKNALPYKTDRVSVDKERIKKAVEDISSYLSGIGYYKWGEEEKWTRILLSDFIERASLTEGELKRFEKIFSKREKIEKYKDIEK